MNFYRFLAVAKKECIHLIRDWRSLFLSIATPIILVLLFAYALTLDVDNVKIVIWDQSKTADSRKLINEFLGSHYFSLERYADNYDDIVYDIDKGSALVAMIIPENFGERHDSRREAKVQIIVDGSDANSATLALGYADAITETLSQSIIVEELNRMGQNNIIEPIDLRTRIWFNPEINSRNNIVPGLIGVIMMVIASLMTSLTIAREWEKGSMEQLISTPIKVPELIFGKMLPYFVLGIIDVTLIVLIGEYVFSVPFKGSILLLYFMAMLFLIGALSLGMLISILTKSQLLASQLAMVITFLPSVLLSGFLSPIYNMPNVIQGITYFIPARYFITFLRAIYLKGIGLTVLYIEGIFLLTFAIVMVTLANLKFKKKLE